MTAFCALQKREEGEDLGGEDYTSGELKGTILSTWQGALQQ